MADEIRISELDAVTTPAPTDEFPVVQSGNTRRMTREQVHTLESGETFVGDLTGAVLDGGGTVHNVKHPDYGATGDGVTDDTTAIQAVITAAGDDGIVFLPAGDTFVTTLTQSDVVDTNFVGGGVLEMASDIELRTQAFRVLPSDWVSDDGGLIIASDPSVLTLPTTLQNTIVVLGGRLPTYPIEIGDEAALAFVAGGGNFVMNHLAGTICGGAHHTMDENSGGFGSHGFIGGGSTNEIRSDYGSIVSGNNNIVWATRAAIVGGEQNTIGIDGDRLQGEGGFIGPGSNCAVQGAYAAVPSGELCTANADYSEASGFHATATLYGARSRASGRFAIIGDAQMMDVTLRRTTSDATPFQLLLDGDSETLGMGSEMLWTITGVVQAMRTDTGTDTASYQITASAYSETGTPVIKSSDVTVLHEDDATWDVDIISSGDVVQVRGTGAAGQTIQWVASLRITQSRI